MKKLLQALAVIMVVAGALLFWGCPAVALIAAVKVIVDGAGVLFALWVAVSHGVASVVAGYLLLLGGVSLGDSL